MSLAAGNRKAGPSESDAILNALPNPVILIGPDGKIALRQDGAVDWSSQRWRRRVESLLPPP